MEKKQLEELMFDKSICSRCGNNDRFGRCLVDNNKVPRGIVECEQFISDDDCGNTNGELGIGQDEPNY